MNTSLLKTLDAPVRFLSFTMGDLLAYLAPIFIGALCDSLVLIPGLGLLIVFSIKKVTRRLPRFYGIRWLYWSLPTRVFNRLLRVEWPHSNQRLWVK